MLMNKDYYKTLGVERNTSQEDIKKQYRKLTKEFHPDKHKDPSQKKTQEQKYKEISEQYNVLNDPDKKRMYDLTGSQESNGGHYQHRNVQDMDDIFGTMFGGNPFDQFFNTRQQVRQPNVQPQRGNDVIQSVSIKLNDVIHDTKKRIQYTRNGNCQVCNGIGGENPTTCNVCGGRGVITQHQRIPMGVIETNTICSHCQGLGKVITKPCSNCRGSGRTQINEDFNVTIPQGTMHGTKIRIQDKGEQGRFGGGNGDLYLQVNIEPHPEFTRQGNNILSTLSIPYIDALLGQEKEINTLYGKSKLKIPQETQPKTNLRLKNKGIKGQDQYVTIDINIPNISNEEKELLNSIKEKFYK